MRRKKGDKEGSWKRGWRGRRGEEGGREHVCTGERGGIKGRKGREELQGFLFLFQHSGVFFRTFIFFFLYSFFHSTLGSVCLHTHTHTQYWKYLITGVKCVLGLAIQNTDRKYNTRHTPHCESLSQTDKHTHKHAQAHRKTQPLNPPRWISIPSFLHIKLYLHWRGLGAVSLFINYQSEEIMMEAWSECKGRTKTKWSWSSRWKSWLGFEKWRGRWNAGL